MRFSGIILISTTFFLPTPVLSQTRTAGEEAGQIAMDILTGPEHQKRFVFKDKANHEFVVRPVPRNIVKPGLGVMVEFKELNEKEAISQRFYYSLPEKQWYWQQATVKVNKVEVVNGVVYETNGHQFRYGNLASLDESKIIFLYADLAAAKRLIEGTAYKLASPLKLPSQSPQAERVSSKELKKRP